MINKQVSKLERFYEDISDETGEYFSGGQGRYTPPTGGYGGAYTPPTGGQYGIYTPPQSGIWPPFSTGITATTPGERFTCYLDPYGRATHCTSELPPY
ncbi:hypothetical protein H6G06_25150 [Anabaena sphaerica FACHB-251]|uniref:Uncharacterized protein n=1 Tax=Anabaena sphaerica FACHB-251 TaxID=2692883 RepID=A0A926WLJ4_9NOST|nr:hypothetical protein [Anabaena sphaerica]MBD2296679.1 hypothetical protein [Anabaena sphaerica FACHB-251]